MTTMGRCVALLAAMTLGDAVRATDATGETTRLRLIAGLDAEKAYLPRLVSPSVPYGSPIPFGSPGGLPLPVPGGGGDGGGAGSSVCKN